MLIGICGLAGSGKDSVADLMVRYHGYTRIGLADPLKAAALRLNPIVYVDHWDDVDYRLSDMVKFRGWDRAKREIPEIRQLLQRLGTEVVRELCGPDFWIDYALVAAGTMSNVVIPDVRFYNEALAIHEAGGYVYRVVRPGITPLPGGHASEAGIPDSLVEFDIENSGSLDDLESKVHSLFNHERFAA